MCDCSLHIIIPKIAGADQPPGIIFVPNIQFPLLYPSFIKSEYPREWLVNKLFWVFKKRVKGGGAGGGMEKLKTG